MYKKVFSLALPNIISNITIPLVGMVDLAIAGALGQPYLIGGIAIGTAIFNLLYWNFGFLRMGTSGLTAQAYGRREIGQTPQILVRALVVALSIAAAILALQIPVEAASLWYMEGSQGVESVAAEYFFIRIWAAPATLSLYAFKGWFIGMQNSKTPMWVAIFINIVNVVASIFCAFWLDMGVAGIALGTVIAQWSGLALSLWFVYHNYRKIFVRPLFEGVFIAARLREFFVLNRDIFIRTLCLTIVFTYFTQASSTMGDLALEANTLLLQLFTLFSYFMDGFAYAGEALAGRYYGAGNGHGLARVVRSIFVVGLLVSVVFTLIYAFLGVNILHIFNPSELVLDYAESYILYAAAVPIVGFAAFLMDGILVGMTRAAIMRNAMIVATALFFGIYLLFRTQLGVDALWIAFLIYLLARGGLQLLLSKHLLTLK